MLKDKGLQGLLLGILLSFIVIAITLPLHLETVDNEISEKKAYFVLTKDGIKDEFSGKTKEVRYYTDFFCPDCVRVHEKAGKQLQEKVNKGEIEIKIYPLNYLSHHTDEFSLKAAYWTLGTSYWQPDKTLDFIDKLYKIDKEEKLKYQDDKQFEELAKSVGINKTTINKIKNNQILLENKINKQSVNIRKNKELLSHSPNERMYVPYIIIDNGIALDGENENVKEAVLDKFETNTNTNNRLDLSEDCQPGKSCE